MASVFGALDKAVNTVNRASATVAGVAQGVSTVQGALGSFNGSSVGSTISSTASVFKGLNDLAGPLGGSKNLSRIGQSVGKVGTAVSGINNALGSIDNAVNAAGKLIGPPFSNVASVISGPLGGLRDLLGGGSLNLSGGLSPGQAKSPGNAPNSFTKMNALQAASGRGDPVLTHEWVAVIIDKENPNVLNPIYIESMKAPTLSFDVDHKYVNGRNHSYAGIMAVDSMTIQLYADYTGTAYKLASSWWEDTIVNESGNFRLPSRYKKTVKLFVHDAKKGVIVEFEFGGCFPTAFDGNQWEYTSSDPQPVTLTLSVDSFYMTGAASSGQAVSNPLAPLVSQAPTLLELARNAATSVKSTATRISGAISSIF